MNLVKLIVQLIVFSVESSIGVNLNRRLKEAIIDVVKSYASECSTVYVIESLDHKSIELEDFKTELLMKIFESINITMRGESEHKLIKNSSLRFCVIILIDSFDSFLKIFGKMTPSTFDVYGLYTFISTSGELQEFDNLMESLWSIKIINAVVLYAHTWFVKAFTFNPFNFGECNKVSKQTINIKADDLFPNKLINLKNCSIRIGAPDFEPFSMLNERQEITGRDVDVMKVVAKSLNFRPDFKFLNDSQPYGFLSDNGSASGAFKVLLDGKAEIILGDYFLKYNRWLQLGASEAFLSSEGIFAIPPGRALHPIEKLLQPFSKLFWLALCVFVVITFSIFYLIGLKCRKFSLKIFGQSSPYFSLVSIALAVSLTKLPALASPRMLIISITIFCLVLQAVYQGSLFKFLQQDSKLKEVQSIDEMIQKDFKFYSDGSMDELLVGHERINKR